jgi:MFS family permease
MSSSAEPVEPMRGSRSLDRGWLHVVIAAFLMLATLPGRTQGLGLITEPLLQDLRLDRVLFANLNLWATLIGAAFCFPAGWLLDRFGLRWVTASIVTLLGAVVWQMGHLAGGAVGMFVLLTLTRGLGQSALSVASISAVGKWFERLALLFLREAPPAAAESGPAPAAERSLTLAEALRTPAFWVFGGGTALFGLVSSGLGLFNEAILAERGYDRATYHYFLVLTTLVALAGQLVCGWLSLWRPLRSLLGVAMFLYAGALIAIPLARTTLHLHLIAILAGVAGGMITVLFFAVWTQAFGRAHLGRIQGAAQMLTVFSSAAGPLLFARCAAWAGSYTPALWALAPLVIALGAASFCVTMPDREPLREVVPPPTLADHGLASL